MWSNIDKCKMVSIKNKLLFNDINVFMWNKNCLWKLYVHPNEFKPLFGVKHFSVVKIVDIDLICALFDVMDYS